MIIRPYLFADAAPAYSRTADKNASPYRSSFTGPTPDTRSIACRFVGRAAASPRSVASLNTTKAGTPSASASRRLKARSLSNRPGS